MRGLKIKAGSLLRIAAESASFALSGLKTDKLRTILSLSGVSIGIFSIVSQFTVVDSLQASLNEGLNEFGSDIVFVEQMPLEADLNENGIFRWWEYISRPGVTYNEYLYLKEHGGTFGQLCWACFMQDGEVIGVCGNRELYVHNKIETGRGFLESELKRGSPVAVAGAFYSRNHHSDSIINIGGIRCTVIGTMEKSGINSANMADADNSVIVPALLAMRMNGYEGCRTSLAIRPKEGVDDNLFSEEITQLMRRCRRLSHEKKDNFSINRLSFIISEMNELFRMIDMVGWIVGIFSLLVGGFGIANIMFVAVKERTSQIGLQKALGATRKTIIFQYLTEAVTLSLTGAGAAMALVWAATLLLQGSPIEFSLSAANILRGTLTSILIGIAAGVAPATAAANLHPAEALVQE